MKYFVLKSAFSAAFLTLGAAFVMLSPELALACDFTPAGCGGGSVSAPEIGATGSLAALAAVGAIATLVYERRKNR